MDPRDIIIMITWLYNLIIEKERRLYPKLKYIIWFFRCFFQMNWSEGNEYYHTT